MAEDQSVSTVTLHMTFPTELVERLKVSLGNLDKKRSASEAIREAIDKIIAETGAVTVRQWKVAPAMFHSNFRAAIRSRLDLSSRVV